MKLVVAFTVVLITAASASAECAWVLWNDQNLNPLDLCQKGAER